MKPILPIALAALLLLPVSASAVTRGTPVPESKYPWMADLLGCGGTLIAPDRVLTAAHCLEPIEGAEEITLTLGSSYEHGTRLKVRRHARHPRFEGNGLMTRYDVALLELAEPVQGISPLPVAQTDPPAGTPATILGHGRRRWFGLDLDATPKRYIDHTRPLVAGTQRIVSDEACRSYYATNRYKRDFFDTADMICSLDPRSTPSRAAGAPWTSVCVGDSGGPLVSRGALVGVVAWSEWCGLRHDPAVFARVSKLRAFALGEPVWAPVAVAAPQVVAEAGQVLCVAPAFEGDATGAAASAGGAAVEVYGAVWTEDGLVVPKAAGLTLAARPGHRYACSIRARNAGGTSRTSASEPLFIA